MSEFSEEVLGAVVEDKAEADARKVIKLEKWLNDAWFRIKQLERDVDALERKLKKSRAKVDFFRSEVRRWK